MANAAKKAVAIGGGILVLALGAFFVLSSRGGVTDLLDPQPKPCPLTGRKAVPEARVDRPAVAVKVENVPVAYPLSGLQKAEVVYEELVEGGLTRFMAVYHCTDAPLVGPVRSARVVDPAIMTPISRILAFSGSNDHVTAVLGEHDIATVTETSHKDAFERVDRAGVSLEHTLYARTKAARRAGSNRSGDPPPEDVFEFGDLPTKGRKAQSITISFSTAAEIGYQWSGGRWLRFQGGQPFVDETGNQVAVDNVVVEEHVVNLSKTIVDARGTPSVEIADETGSGRAVLFRNGRAFPGRWRRDAPEDPVVFETKSGRRLVFDRGSVWIHLVPSDAGEVKGSFTYE